MTEKIDKPKFLVYDRAESLWESLASDAATCGGLLFCTWFSLEMGGGFWTFLSAGMFLAWMLCKMPWERVTRTIVIKTKEEAMAWAKTLPEDKE